MYDWADDVSYSVCCSADSVMDTSGDVAVELAVVGSD